MSSRPPTLPPIYTTQSGAAPVARAAAPSTTMTEAHPQSAWSYGLPPPHLLANPYNRLPPPAHLQQLPEPPPPPIQPQYATTQRAKPSLYAPTPQTATTATTTTPTTTPRWSAMPIDRLLIHQPYSPPVTSSPYSPRRTSQLSPGPEFGSRPASKRTYESAQQLEGPALYVDTLGHNVRCSHV